MQKGVGCNGLSLFVYLTKVGIISYSNESGTMSNHKRNKKLKTTHLVTTPIPMLCFEQIVTH